MTEEAERATASSSGCGKCRSSARRGRAHPAFVVAASTAFWWRQVHREPERLGVCKLHDENKPDDVTELEWLDQHIAAVTRLAEDDPSCEELRRALIDFRYALLHNSQQIPETMNKVTDLCEAQ